MYQREAEMYSPVRNWLNRLLKAKYPQAEIVTEITAEKTLSRWLFQKNFHVFFPDYQTYEIDDDITAFINFGNNADLVFIECKLNQITLRDVSQILGYSKVAKPLRSIIMSPNDLSTSLNTLLKIYNRIDILNYYNQRYIIICKWDPLKNDINMNTIIPTGAQI